MTLKILRILLVFVYFIVSEKGPKQEKTFNQRTLKV